MDLVFWWRVSNVVLASIAFVYIMLDLRRRYMDLSNRRLYLTLSLAATMLSSAVGTIALLLGWDLIISRAIFTAGAFWTILGLYISRRDPT